MPTTPLASSSRRLARAARRDVWRPCYNRRRRAHRRAISSRLDCLRSACRAVCHGVFTLRHRHRAQPSLRTHHAFAAPRQGRAATRRRSVCRTRPRARSGRAPTPARRPRTASARTAPAGETSPRISLTLWWIARTRARGSCRLPARRGRIARTAGSSAPSCTSAWTAVVWPVVQVAWRRGRRAAELDRLGCCGWCQ